MLSIQARDKPGREVREGTFVGDCEGLDMRQVSHLPSKFRCYETIGVGNCYRAVGLTRTFVFSAVTFVLSTAIKYRDIIEQGLGRIIVINGKLA